jgi:hypothetical protein
MSGDDIALDFMSEDEVAEILATEELLEVDMGTFDEYDDEYDDLLMDAELDSDTN